MREWRSRSSRGGDVPSHAQTASSVGMRVVPSSRISARSKGITSDVMLELQCDRRRSMRRRVARLRVEVGVAVVQPAAALERATVDAERPEERGARRLVQVD